VLKLVFAVGQVLEELRLAANLGANVVEYSLEWLPSVASLLVMLSGTWAVP